MAQKKVRQADLGSGYFNKVGDAYGFLTDAAYVIDTG
jgi:hypothetical protein